MRDLKTALRGVSAKVGSRKRAVLRQLPLIAEIEAMLDRPGVTWTPAFEQRRDAISLALFGITEADTRPVEPHPDQIEDNGPAARWRMSDDALAAYNIALDRWHEWQRKMTVFDRAIKDRGIVSCFARLGYDVTDDVGDPLRCMQYFARQLYVAHMGLLPGAKVTLSGSGKRVAQSAEDWGAALAAEAARFRPSR